MKLKTILSTLALNAYAYTGHGYRIVNEKVTHSPNFNGGFIEGSKKNTAMFVGARSWAYDANGSRMEYIKIQGDHSVDLFNGTKEVRRYTYAYNLNCESAYENVERTLDINPGGSFSDSSHSYGVVQKESNGSWRINVSTNITGYEGIFHESHAVLRVN